ncbi:MAG: adenylyltransferase/cytidyltransferase family protein [Bacilli bacterium]
MKKVITYGTFDLFHQGHYNILKRAKELGDYLIVGVTSETYDFDRGKLNVKDSLQKRIDNVKKTGLADEIIVEEYQGQKVNDILKYDVDVFVVGSDWIGKFDYLKKYCKVVYLERTKNISSTSIRESMGIYDVGIVTDENYDNNFIMESKFVSGIHVDSVFSKDSKIGKEFKLKYELRESEDDYSKFLKKIDIVYIKCKLDERYKYCKEALIEKKHIIVDTPISLDKNKLEELFALADSNGVLIIENIACAYLRGFNQLVWLINCGIIGNLLSVHFNMCIDSFTSIQEALVYPFFFSKKLLSCNPKKVEKSFAKYCGSSVYYINMSYDNTIVEASLYKNLVAENKAILMGSKGTIEIPDDWWNIGFFEAKFLDSSKKRYSFNSDGNGMRYLLQEGLIMIGEHKTESIRVFNKDSIDLANLIKEIFYEEK